MSRGKMRLEPVYDHYHVINPGHFPTVDVIGSFAHSWRLVECDDRSRKRKSPPSASSAQEQSHAGA